MGIAVEPAQGEQRSATSRRTAYVANAPQEAFIVPLVNQHTQAFLNEVTGSNCAGKTILDVGCGSQPFRSLLESKGLVYRSLDVASIQDVSIDYVCPIDAPLSQELTERQFDFILCTEVLEHVANWPLAFANLSSLLTDGGKILITCPHVYQLHEVPFDYYRPTVHAIEYFAQQHQLKAIKLEQAGSIWDVLGTVLANSRFFATNARFPRRWLARFVERLRKWTLRKLMTGRLQRLIQGECAIYLSNVAVLEKQSST